VAGRRFAFLAAMPIEVRPLVKRLSLRRTTHDGRPAYEGALGDADVIATVTGMGPSNAAAATAWVLDTGPVDHVVNVGVAGGVSPRFKVPDLVMPEVVVDRVSGRTFRPTRIGGHEHEGTLLTVTEIEFDRAVHATLAADGIVAMDMETAGIARVCEERGVPWSVFRALSDHVDDELVDEAVFGMSKPDGRPDPVAVVRYVVSRPWRVPRLVRLGRDLTAATDNAVDAAIAALSAGDG
jgi:adenosylhomocysteine nucleosidase